jgi:c-di-GMP-binding flagellar brake protein YcgR
MDLHAKHLETLITKQNECLSAIEKNTEHMVTLLYSMLTPEQKKDVDQKSIKRQIRKKKCASGEWSA